jgi:predicted metal-dependent phosphotriesterase family hydrolase
VLAEFVPEFRKAGGTEEQVMTLLNTNPRRLLGDAFDMKEG